MSPLPQTRQSLLLRLRRNSDDAWSEFLEIYEQAIYTFARRRGLQDADAWDVTQEVLVAVEKKVESWHVDPEKGKFRGWLYRVARNVAVDKIHKQFKRAAGSGDTQVARVLTEHPDALEQESTSFWINYRRKILHWASDQVKPDFKETSWKSFWMTSIEGKNAEEVAHQLNITVGSVYAAKFRIVNRIRKVVSRLDDLEHGEEEFISEFRSG